MFCRAIISSLCFFFFLPTQQHNTITRFFRHFMSDLPSPQIMAGKHECMRDLQPPVSPLEQKLFPVMRTSLPPPAAEVRQKTDNLMCFKDYLGAADQRLTNSVVTLAEGYGTRLADHDCHKVRFITLCKRKRRSNGASDGWKKVGRLCSKGLFPQKEIACKQTDKQTGRHV